MCPLYPFHMFLLYLCLLLPLLLAVVQAAEELKSALTTTVLPSSMATMSGTRWSLSLYPEKIVSLQEQNVSSVKVSCKNCGLGEDPPESWNSLKLILRSSDPEVASVEFGRFKELDKESGDVKEIVMDLGRHGFTQRSQWSFDFNISGNFLGFAKVSASLVDSQGHTITKDSTVETSVVRKKTVQSKVFAYSVAILVSLAYVNMGCALDMEVVRQNIRQPVGPLIGFICQYLMMPVISFALGFLFSSWGPMRLGLFVTGCSPGGGASNIWTVMYDGNLDLSVTMTAISTFSAFFMMPLWIFTLGQVIFNEAAIVIPYYKICIYAFFLVLPLSCGLVVARYFPRIGRFLANILKPLSYFLIIFIIVFGVWANLFIFSLMTWQVLVAGLGLPWIGYVAGYSMAKICQCNTKDSITIAIETGVQNTGVSIFILWFTFDQPLGDMTAVVPIAAATMTPIPLLIGLVVKKLMISKKKKLQIPPPDNKKEKNPNLSALIEAEHNI